jgi:DNA-binding LytR/AlgR family response regulator
MITAIAIDDEPLAIQVITEFASRIDFVDLKATFTRAGKALEYLNDNPVDLLFLDIEMPLISGIDFYKIVPRNTMVIFTTAYSQYAIEGFNLDAVDYLLKPFDQLRFTKAVEKAREMQLYKQLKNAGEAEYLSVKVDYSIRKIDVSEILYVEGKDNYIKLHFDNGKNLLVRMSMKTLMEQLPDGRFVRVHRSYIVPKQKVSAFRNKTIYINSIDIPTSALYMEDVIRFFGAEK